VASPSSFRFREKRSERDNDGMIDDPPFVVDGWWLVVDGARTHQPPTANYEPNQ
jgi:hypothetical protein